MAKSTSKTSKSAKAATSKTKATATKKAKPKVEKVEKEIVEVENEILDKDVIVEEPVRDEVELTVKGNLAALYKLQRIESKIDKIRIIKGELPLEVEDLEDEVEGMSTRIANIISENEQLAKEIQERKNNSKERNSLIKRYEEQLNNVKNSREYDNLNKEVEYQDLEIQINEKHIKEIQNKIAITQEDIKQYQANLEELKSELEIKKSELDDIVSETELEEKELTELSLQQKKVIEERLLSAYERIRNSARNGLAVVLVERNSCGGCFNSIPPQRQLDIKSHKKIIVCEFCGRILIDEDLAEEYKDQI